MGLSVFQQATLAMMSQSHKLSTLSQNIANVNTDGYKRTDTEFQTLINRGFTSVGATTGEGSAGTTHSDFGGVNSIDLQRISKQGQIRTTDRNLDVAIIGDGFFMVSPDINVNGDIQYTRRGAFDINVTDLQDTVTLDGNTYTVNQGYLADQFGNFLLGFSPNADGTFSLNGNPAPMRVDQFAFEDQGEETTTASLDINLPADDDAGTVHSGSIQVVDSEFEAQDLRIDFTKVFGSNNLWDFRVLGDNISTISASPGATFSNVVTRQFNAANPTAPTDAVRFSTVAGSGGVITVFSDLNPGGTPQLGTPQSGTFAGLKAGDQITITGAGANNGTYTIATVSESQAEITLDAATPLASSTVTGSAVTFGSNASIPQRLQFGSDGTISTPENYTFNVTFNSGGSTTFDLDVSTFTQFSGDFSVSNFSHDGAEAASLASLNFGDGGEIFGEFTDNTRRALFKVPIAVFPNPDALEINTGQNFRETEASGEPTIVFADESGFANFLGNALEGSNVDLGTEMTRLIAAQSAYNVAATTFKTADEMLQEAGNLKR